MNAPNRVLMVSQTEAISTQVTNQDTVMCDITLSLVAPTFTLQPKDNQRLIQLAPTASSTVTWRVTPTAVGLATLAFTAGNASEQIGLSVMSGNGFIPYQSQTFDYLAIFFGFLLTLASLVAWQWWSNRRTSIPRGPEAEEYAATPAPPSSHLRQSRHASARPSSEQTVDMLPWRGEHHDHGTAGDEQRCTDSNQPT